MEAIEPVLSPGHLPWYIANAIAFIVCMIVAFALIFYGLTSVSDISEVSKNWSKYRCDPSIMPFASLYGYNTAENFNYCMGNIFGTYSSDMTSSFSTVLGSFSSIIGTLMTAVTSIRSSVATLGGGINVVFQNFTDRITLFFYTLRVSAIRIKTLIGRMYAVMFAVMYMGMSAITGLTSFTNTTLFSFLDTFCFPADTILSVKGRGDIPIRDVQIGDILLPTESRVSATFIFHAKGQPMVRFKRCFAETSSTAKDILVSTNHYMWDLTGNGWVRADEHSEAHASAPWGEEPLYCLNTSDHVIPIDKYRFNDYDETSAADKKTMAMIQAKINGEVPLSLSSQSIYTAFNEYSPALSPDTELRMRNGANRRADQIVLGDEFITGARVVGVIQKQIREFIETPTGHRITPATLVWRETVWIRAGEYASVQKAPQPLTYISFIVSPSSQIELADGTRIRDYMELCSPDAERYYAEELKQLNL